jgi:hypothetical protein
MKKCSTFPAIKEIKIKTTLRFQLNPVRNGYHQEHKTTNVGENVGKKEPS